jgi:2-amino-4-hydroxy-6-hydroxymethyldihydropteridine diphosphokinase
MMEHIAYIALGSNLGDRRGYLERALQRLRETENIRVTRVSRFFETAPVGGPCEQPNFFNGAAELRTQLGPEELLRALLDIERELGRTRGERDGPRTIDLDLLFHGNTVRNTPDPILPHPRLHQRRFVLEPLNDIAPDFRHPVLGSTLRELLHSLPQEAAMPPRPELAGLRAVITGSTRGIGWAIAQEFNAAGALVVINGRSIDSAASRIGGAKLSFIPADLSIPAECARLVVEAWRHLGRIDVWVNNAGSDTLTGDAARWNFGDKLHRLLEVDVNATIALSREVGRRMKDAGSGSIINIGWDQAETGMEGDSGQLFAVAKSAVMGFTKSLAKTLAPEVRVNCLAPGWIRTAWGESASAYWHDRVRRETPMARWGTPQDVAAAARWLASPAASFITGQVIRVNGGAV